MSRSLILGNGKMLVCFDDNYQMRDLYYPYVGMSNHIGSHNHLIGVWVDGVLSKINQKEWDLSIKYHRDTIVSDVLAVNKNLQLSIKISDAVYNEDSIFVRNVKIKNLASRRRMIKLYISQEFTIDEVSYGNTVFFDPRDNVIIHYKRNKMFLINAKKGNKKGFDDYSCGVVHWQGKESSFYDGLDGKLERNNIQHGSVDSVVGFDFGLHPGKTASMHYWIAVGDSLKDVKKKNLCVLKKGPSHLLRTTGEYWTAWGNKQHYKFCGLHDNVIDLFKRSLFTCRILTDNNGASIASPDSDILQFGRDTYAYMWPRDEAFTVLALDKAWYNSICGNSLEFCAKLLVDEGFFMHKYLLDGSLGSSWHPWMEKGKLQYPIQEDETSLMLFALEQHYERVQSVEFIEKLYNPFIKKAADFLVEFRDKQTRLPKQSYDLWEERLGVHTFTCATVYVGLMAAASFSKLLGKKNDFRKYSQAAQEVREGIIKYLYDKEKGFFIRRMYLQEDGNYKKDYTLDLSAFYSIFRFGILPPSAPEMQSTFKHVLKKLKIKTPLGGFARYEKDIYMSVSKEWEKIPGNPWIICTLWVADYYISIAQNKDDLKKAEQIIHWVADHACESGLLAEQLDPYKGTPVSVMPLTWSHAQLIITVLFYLKRYSNFEGIDMVSSFKMKNVC